MGNRRAKLYDVAEKAGVSKSTVSRVLNNKLGNGFSVREEVRLRVLKVAEQLNYRPNLIAQSLTKQQTRMISIIGGGHALSDLGNIYQTVVNNATGVLDASDEGFDVTVDMSKHCESASELPAWRVDGVIVLAKCTEITMDQLATGSVPYVVINGPAGERGCSVVPDDVGGMRAAMKHLIGLGHERIAYAGPLGKPLEGHSSLSDRHDTYISEMEKHGLEAIVSSVNDEGDAKSFLEKMVLGKGVTAVVAYGHMGGLNLMQAAGSLGIGVPERVSLICFCDEYANSVMSPRLSFVDLRTKEMGQTAAELLIRKIRQPNETSDETVLLEERLVLRESTGKPFGG